MNLRKRIVSFGLAAAVMFTSVVTFQPSTVKAEDTLELKPANELVFSDETSEYGYRGVTLSQSLKGKSFATNPKFALLKAEPAYRNSHAALSASLPATRSQDPYGTCWAFSTVAMAEANLINKGMAGTDVDLSELHLAYFTYHNVVDPIGGTNGDYNGELSSDGYLDMGGNRFASSRVLFSGRGLAAEASYPYTWAIDNKYLSLDPNAAYSSNVAMIKDAYLFAADPSDFGSLESVKWAIQSFGAVGCDYNADAGAYKTVNYNGEAFGAYYCPAELGANHAVTIVGWDDNFPAEGFTVYDQYGNPYAPSANGGWLVRNSWTTDSNDAAGNAYFWLSYYDPTLSNYFWAWDMEAAYQYNNYQYDGGYFSQGTDQATTMANVFTPKNNEYLQAVVVSNTVYSYENVTIKVYTNLKDKSKPTSGKLVLSQNAQVIAGHHQIKLDKAIPVAKGTSYSVVVVGQCVEVEIPVTDGGWYTTVQASGNSYIYHGGSWLNSNKVTMSGLRVGDCCIKALTTNGPALSSQAASVMSFKNKPSASSSAKKTLVVKWKKNKNASGYEVQVAKNSKFTKGVKTVKVGNTTKATVKKLASNKKYYIRIRAFIKKDGFTNYSGWVKAKKTVKVK